MAASRSIIRTWFEEGVAKGYTHMIVMCDTYDHEDYPVYVSAEENVREVANRKGRASMQQLMEVYSLLSDPEPQLQPGTRVMNFEHTPSGQQA